MEFLDLNGLIDYNSADNILIKSFELKEDGKFSVKVSSFTNDLTVLITFSKNHHFMQFIDESSMLQPDYFDFKSTSFFKVSESKFLNLFHTMSCDIYKEYNFCHYGIFTMDKYFSIIAAEDPKVIQL
tara:strand:+ start:696 stop:1076 length:381 start_codon:yes stop_codon:yes gene_type:complete